MDLSSVPKIIDSAGAGPLPFVALGLLVLTYLSARWFSTEKTAVRLTIFVALFFLICAAPALLWLSERKITATTMEGADTNRAQPEPKSDHVPSEKSARSSSVNPEPEPVRTQKTAGTGDGKKVQGATNFVEVSPTIELKITRFESALRSGVFTVYFPMDYSELPSTELNFLDDVADEFARRPNRSVSIIGHTDSRNSATYNVGLSQRMASQVATHLSARGVPASSITTQAVGESRPAIQTPDNTPEPQNRRVEISFEPKLG